MFASHRLLLIISPLFGFVLFFLPIFLLWLQCAEHDDGWSYRVKLADFWMYLKTQQDDSPLYIYDATFDVDKKVSERLPRALLKAKSSGPITSPLLPPPHITASFPPTPLFLPPLATARPRPSSRTTRSLPTSPRRTCSLCLRSTAAPPTAGSASVPKDQARPSRWLPSSCPAGPPSCLVGSAGCCSRPIPPTTSSGAPH